jgi:hypothetical protein
MGRAPLISVYTVIGRNVDLLDQWISGVCERAGMDDYAINLVLWNPTAEVMDYVSQMAKEVSPHPNRFKYVIYNPTDYVFRGHPDHRYVFDLYNCFNMGYEMSPCKYVLRSGSDQIFSKNFLKDSWN